MIGKACENQNKQFEYDDIIYLINSDEKTASVIGSKENHQTINIPVSINHKSKEYYVTSILENAFYKSKIKNVQFSSESKLHTICKNAFSFSTIKRIRIPSSVTSIGDGAFYFCTQLEVIEISDDSKLQTIGKDAFSESKITSIKIPSELIDLKDEWCSGIKNLTKISVSPENSRYYCYEDKMIIGKSRIEKNNYDCLVFCVRNIQRIKIPCFIEHICSYSFQNCEQLETIEFSNDSKLQIIDKNAFLWSSIKRIRIPSSVISIGESAFSGCDQLEVIEISDDSKLQTIGKDAFSESRITSIKIPSELIDLKEGWCSGIENLTKISVSPENPRYCFFDDKMIIGKSIIEKNNYDCIVFCVRDIQRIKIPNFIKHICSYSFDLCRQLKTVEFSNDSKLETIDKRVFCSSKIKRIQIPSSVISFEESAFSDCDQLEMIEIPDDSKLQTIDGYAFNFSKIESIKIPSKLIDLKDEWCKDTRYLTKISVSPENPRYFCYEDKMIIGKSRIEENNYDCLVFCVRNIQRIKIPSFIEHICSYSFHYCEQLETIEFSNDSKLETIDKRAFCSSTIKRIQIPSSVTSIGENAFSFCKQLEVIEIPDDSKLQTIGKDAFSELRITSIVIPSSVTSIGEYAFYICSSLCIIEARNSEMISLYQKAFEDCQNALLMIPVHS